MSGQSERRALGLAGVVLLLGVSVRLARAVHAVPPPTPAEVRALDAQIARVDSARAAGRATRVTARVSSRSPSRGAEGAPSRKAAPPPVDLDAATAAEIEALPWIGPALAARIVESRARCGPFGSLEGLERVYGIGSASARRLAPYVTFSAASRPTSAARPPGCAGADVHAARRPRDRP